MAMTEFDKGALFVLDVLKRVGNERSDALRAARDLPIEASTAVNAVALAISTYRSAVEAAVVEGLTARRIKKE